MVSAFDKGYYPGGATHTIEARDLKSVNGSTPDTCLYVFSRQPSPLGTYYWRLEAKDDDGGDGYASKVVNVAMGGVVRVIVAAYSPYKRGTCDIRVVTDVRGAPASEGRRRYRPRRPMRRSRSR